MAKNYFFGTCSATKTYASADNAEKAFNKIYGNYEVRFMIIQLAPHNCEDSKLHGRFIPVAIGQEAMELGVHWNFHIIG